MDKRAKTVVRIGVAAAVVVGVGAVVTATLGGTETTTGLDSGTTVTVDGTPALKSDIVAGRTQSRYHVLPWLGTAITGTTCPAGLKAEVGAAITCTAKEKDGGAEVKIPVTVTQVSGTALTWRFDR